MFRQSLLRTTRLFSTTARVNKGPVEGAKDAVKTADRTVSDQIVKGIEKGRKSTNPSSRHIRRQMMCANVVLLGVL